MLREDNGSDFGGNGPGGARLSWSDVPSSGNRYLSSSDSRPSSAISAAVGVQYWPLLTHFGSWLVSSLAFLASPPSNENSWSSEDEQTGRQPLLR